MAKRPPSAESQWLPPRDAQLIDPRREKIETPVDEYGLIDVDELIDAVQDTVDPAYEWRQVYADRHHLYWPAAHYPWQDEPGNPRRFRELSVHKALLSREFHNWLHQVTEPPAQPSREVMEHVSEAYDASKQLYGASQGLVRAERQARRSVARKRGGGNTAFEELGEEEIDLPGFEQHRAARLHRVRLALVKAAAIPQEFRLAEVGEKWDSETIARKLGKVVAGDARVLKRRATA